MRNSHTSKTSSGRWEVGERIGDYELLAPIGAGGMGCVYHARHSATGRDVAIKTIAAADAELVLRFQREAEALARVDAHPAVVRIHSAGSSGGRPYLVMDYLPGGSLSQRLEGGPLPAQEAAWIVAELARGLAHVHQHGILHRDLKPQNVLLDEDDGPHLADFGLAQVEGADGLTRTGATLGTIGYMAPEQALGKTHQIDARTDVYGLGGILFTALTGRAPFLGKAHEVVKAVVESPPPSARQFVADVPPELDAICLRALARRPDDRPSSAQELADQLDGFLAGPSPDPLRSHATLLLSLAGLALALALTLVLALALRPDSPQRPPSPTASATVTLPLPAASVEVEGDPAPRVDASAHPPGDCIRLARKLRGAREHADRHDLIDAEAYLIHAHAEEAPLAGLELGMIQLELGHDAEGIAVLEASLAQAPLILELGQEAAELVINARLCLAVALVENRRGGPYDVRDGVGHFGSACGNLQSLRISSGELPKVHEARLRAVAQPETATTLLALLEDPEDQIAHFNLVKELAHRAEDMLDEGLDPSFPVRVLETLATDGRDDPFAWINLADYYEEIKRYERALELFLRVGETPAIEPIRARARRKAAYLLSRGRGAPKDLDAALELLDDRTLRHTRNAAKLREELEEELRERDEESSPPR